MSAATDAGCVAGVNRFDLDAMFTSDVRDLQEERRERPPVHNQSLLLGAFDPRADAFEVFDGYRPRAGFRRFIHDPVGHVDGQVDGFRLDPRPVELAGLSFPLRPAAFRSRRPPVELVAWSSLPARSSIIVGVQIAATEMEAATIGSPLPCCLGCLPVIHLDLSPRHGTR